MKKFTLLIAVMLLLVTESLAQAPESFKYQAVARNRFGSVLREKQVDMQISILQSSPAGASVYVETHTTTTSKVGLINLNIGQGTVVSGDFSAIDWSANTYFMKVEMKYSMCGDDYEEIGTSQLLSVPYALYAKTSGSISETDPIFTAWDKSSGINIYESQILDLQTYLTTEAQNLFDVLTIDNDGGTLQIKNIADPTNDQDAATKAYVDALEERVAAIEAILSGSCLDSITDFDGNKYPVVKIGSQIWMAENLKTTHYANGDEIPDGTGAGNLIGETDPKYWFAYDDDMNNVDTYGRLYTWYAATDSRSICPDGWHVPSHDEWTILTTYLGGESGAGGKLKETGTVHWRGPNTGATNETGFTGLPGGYRSYNGSFLYIEDRGYWWTTTQAYPTTAYHRRLFFYSDDVFIKHRSKKRGYSVRCVKD